MAAAGCTGNTACLRVCELTASSAHKRATPVGSHNRLHTNNHSEQHAELCMYKGRTLCICTQQLAAVFSVLQCPESHDVHSRHDLGQPCSPVCHASSHYSRTVVAACIKPLLSRTVQNYCRWPSGNSTDMCTDSRYCGCPSRKSLQRCLISLYSSWCCARR